MIYTKKKREIQLSDLPDKEKYNEARRNTKSKLTAHSKRLSIIQYKGKIGGKNMALDKLPQELREVNFCPKCGQKNRLERIK